MTRKIRTLLFSTLYPSSVRPRHGIFVETRLRELLASKAVETRVVAPVPWFFSTHPRYGDYARAARTPMRETHNGIEVEHPRYFLPPKVGMTVAPLSLALGAIATVRRLIREGFDFDLIDAHYYYPDGVAAALIAKWINKPFVVTARGTDLNVIPRYRLPRRMIRWTVGRAAASIGVSRALVDVLRGLGAPEDKVHVMRNGVDLSRFHPVPQNEARQALGLSGSPILLSVGNLVENKGHNFVIDVLAGLLTAHPDACLVIIGDGPDKQNLQNQVARLGLSERVRFVATLPNTDLATWYSAADVLILASSREGWPNILLESMACGTPVVATKVGGTPEIVTTDMVGWLVDRLNVSDLLGAVDGLLIARPDRAAVRAYAGNFGWAATTQAQLVLFNNVASSTGDDRRHV